MRFNFFFPTWLGAVRRPVSCATGSASALHARDGSHGQSRWNTNAIDALSNETACDTEHGPREPVERDAATNRAAEQSLGESELQRVKRPLARRPRQTPSTAEGPRATYGCPNAATDRGTTADSCASRNPANDAGG